MLDSKKISVVLPAFNSEKTLEKTFRQIPLDVVDDVILVDDGSTDQTVALSKHLGIRTFVHEKNTGYGGNLKTCFREALAAGADIIVVLHPDCQYDPRYIPAMSSLLAQDLYDAVLCSRMLCSGALQGGMPLYKFVFNKALTFFENVLTWQNLSEFHTGYRAYSRQVIATLPLLENEDDFLFDNQILLQIFHFGFRLGELSCPAKYDADSSSVSFWKSVRYGRGVLKTALQYRAARTGLIRVPFLEPKGRRVA